MGRSFKDASDAVWDCRVDWAAMRRSAAAGVDLSLAEQFMGDWYRGSPKLMDALWAVLEPTAAARGVSRDTFEAATTGEVIDTAREALIEGIVDFFPPTRGELVEATAQEVAAEIRALRDRLPNASTVSRESAA